MASIRIDYYLLVRDIFSWIWHLEMENHKWGNFTNGIFINNYITRNSIDFGDTQHSNQIGYDSHQLEIIFMVQQDN